MLGMKGSQKMQKKKKKRKIRPQPVSNPGRQIPKILREISFWDYRRSKNCQFDIFEAHKLGYDNFCNF